jgi:hypothetical protein
MKYVFGSPGWLAAIHGIIAERAAWESKARPNLSMSVCEVFLNAPGGLANAEGAKIAWSCVVDGAHVDFQLRERDDLRFKVLAEYEALLPLGRYDTRGEPTRAVELARMAAELIGSGKMRTVGARVADPAAMTSVHDAIARLTQ